MVIKKILSLYISDHTLKGNFAFVLALVTVPLKETGYILTFCYCVQRSRKLGEEQQLSSHCYDYSGKMAMHFFHRKITLLAKNCKCC